VIGRPGARRFLPPVLVSLVFIAWAPFIGQIRNWLKATLPGAWVGLVAGGIGLALLVAIVAAVASIRDRRLVRYGLLAAAVGLFAGYAWWVQTGNAEVDAVERFHFIEYGIVASLFYRAFLPRGDRSVGVLALLAGFLVGTLEEWVQWLVPTRTGVAEDVCLNLVALVCGLCFAAGLMGPEPFRRPAGRTSWPLISRMAAVVLLVFAAFFHCAHLGHEIDNGEERFRSYFTAAALERLTEVRREEWQRAPPTQLRALGVEDYYMTEGGWHVRARNDAYGRGDFRTAWHENRILEKHYEPFLDVVSFVGNARHRWHPDQRAEVEGKRPQAAGYLSATLVDRIVVRPAKPVYWVLVILVVAAAWIAPVLTRGFRFR
jgi:hypothetical protein